MKFVHALVAFAFYTASFDLFLIVNIGGSLRAAQIAVVALIVIALAHVLHVHTVLWPRGGVALAIFTALQGLLISRSDAPTISIELYLLLLSCVFGIFAVLQFYGRSARLFSLMRTYLHSFVFVAAFGIYQFVAPALHLGHPFITQWIAHGIIPRLNGLNYEPSYYATYLIVGWIALIDLRASRAEITAGRRWFWLLLLVSVALFLSTSKTVWILMAGEGVARLAPGAIRLLRRQAARLSNGSLVVPLPRVRTLLAIACVAVAAAVITAGVSMIVNLNIFLMGSGLNNTPAHSFNTRLQGFQDTLKVAVKHPWLGISLGGVPAAVAALHGQHVTNYQDVRLWWGFPVLLDLYAAGGLIGFIPFLWFCLSITVGETRLIRSRWHDDRAKWLHALIRAFIFEWLALLADQNVLRVYLWFQMTMMVVIAYSLRYSSPDSSPTISHHPSSTAPPSPMSSADWPALPARASGLPL